MNANEQILASKMLEEFSDILAGRGCNDFNFPDSWTEEEKEVFVRDFHVWNGDPEEFDKDNWYISNFCVAMFLSEKLKSI